MVEFWKPGDGIARYIDHTLLKPGATEADIARLCEEAVQYGFKTVCVNGAWVSYCKERLPGTGVGISAVVGFPLGAMASRVKAYETAQAVEDGATEIDMVLHVGLVLQGRYGTVAHDIASVLRNAGKGVPVKVILETGLLNDEQIAEACRVAEVAGAAYVKTSTGFGPGGATEAHVKLMRASVSRGVGVKASGGIRDAHTALQMLLAGANRLGTSSGAAIVKAEAAAAGKEPATASSDATREDNRGEEPEANTPY